MSAMIWVQYGPITIAVRSMTRTPTSGPVLSIAHRLSGHLEAVPDVVGVAGGNDGKDDGVFDIPDGVDVSGDLLHRPGRPVNSAGFGNHHPGDAPRDRRQDLARDRA